MITSKRQAENIAGTLGNPSKMPGRAYGIPAALCLVGSMLRAIAGSVCSKCYALKGRYVFANVLAAQQRRFDSLRHPEWVDAMVYLISHSGTDCFRWHDSGDIQGLWHLQNIVAIANRLPDVRFWIPTRENRVVREYLRDYGNFPTNLIVRVSAAMIGGKPIVSFPHTSTVVTDGSHTCPAYKQSGMCGDCRACWSHDVPNVSYPQH